MTEEGPACDEWRFARNRLVRLKPFPTHSGNAKASYAIDYRSASNGLPPVLHLESLTFDGRPAVMCPCDYEYFLLDADNDELEMMGRALPTSLVVYDPRDAERWFLSREKCDRARENVKSALERDGLQATKLGLHAVVSSLGL